MSEFVWIFATPLPPSPRTSFVNGPLTETPVYHMLEETSKSCFNFKQRETSFGTRVIQNTKLRGIIVKYYD